MDTLWQMGIITSMVMHTFVLAGASMVNSATECRVPVAGAQMVVFTTECRVPVADAQMVFFTTECRVLVAGAKSHCREGLN